MVSSLRSWGVEVTRRLGPTGPPNFSGPLLRPPPHLAPFPSTKPFSYKTVSRLRHSNLASCTRLPVHASGLRGRHGEPAGARGGHGVQLLPSACYSPQGDTELATDRSSAMPPRPPGSPSSPGPHAGLRPAGQPLLRPLPTSPVRQCIGAPLASSYQPAGSERGMGAVETQPLSFKHPCGKTGQRSQGEKSDYWRRHLILGGVGTSFPPRSSEVTERDSEGP